MCGSIEACLNCPNTDTCNKPVMDFEVQESDVRDKKATSFKMYSKMDRREYFHLRWMMMDKKKKEHMRENARKWQANNRERNKETCRSYYQKHAEEIKAKKKKEYYRRKKEALAV